MKIDPKGNTKGIMKRILVSVLVAMMMVTLLPAGSLQVAKAEDTTVETPDNTPDNTPVEEAAAPIPKKTITVTGLAYEKNEYSKKRAQDVIRVTGAYGRKVELQMRQNGKWVTKRSFPITEWTRSRVVLQYPERSKTYTYWRVHIAGDSETMAYNSSPITFVSRNVKGLNLNARSACIYCMDTGKVVYGRNMKKKLPMASTTKIMTAVVVMENMKMTKKARISRRAARTPYRNLYMKRGDRYYVKDLFRAMLVSSSNDAARALAENTAGSSSKFVKMMNRKAKKLGLKRTHYTDEVGFGSWTHRSSAKDLAKLMTYAYQSKTFRTSINRKTYSFRNVRRSRWHKVWSSSYPMYRFSKNYLGGKTGTTSAARCCFVAVYRYGGKTYVCVNLGSRNNFYRWRDSKRMYKYIRNYATRGALRSIKPEEPEDPFIYPEGYQEQGAQDQGDVAGDGQDVGTGDGQGDGTGDGQGDGIGDGGIVIPYPDGGNGEVLRING